MCPGYLGKTLPLDLLTFCTQVQWSGDKQLRWKFWRGNELEGKWAKEAVDYYDYSAAVWSQHMPRIPLFGQVAAISQQLAESNEALASQTFSLQSYVYSGEHSIILKVYSQGRVYRNGGCRDDDHAYLEVVGLPMDRTISWELWTSLPVASSSHPYMPIKVIKL